MGLGKKRGRTRTFNTISPRGPPHSDFGPRSPWAGGKTPFFSPAGRGAEKVGRQFAYHKRRVVLNVGMNRDFSANPALCAPGVFFFLARGRQKPKGHRRSAPTGRFFPRPIQQGGRYLAIKQSTHHRGRDGEKRRKFGGGFVGGAGGRRAPQFN